MPFNIKFNRSVQEGTTVISQTETIVTQGCDKRSEVVADAATDYEIIIGIDVSSLKIFAIESDQNVTVETNNGAAPTDTISLTANKPVTWLEGDPALFSADVTALYITNASGAAATISVISGTDTP